MSDVINIQLSPHPDYIHEAVKFWQKYELIDMVMPTDIRFDKRKLKPKRERVCRFCGSSMPKAKFPNEAHLFSEMIGNKDLFSDFECKACNLKLSSFENDFANFLGISRTILRVNTKGGIPDFKSQGKKLIARAKSFLGNDIIIIAKEDLESGAIEHDLNTGKITINYFKNPYTPEKVYKALFKWALSVLNEKEVKENYAWGLSFLNGRGVLTSCRITGYKLPFQFNFPPRAYLFEKRNPEDKIHSHVMAVCFQNDIISFPVPLHKKDLALFHGESIEPPIYPPLFNQFENTAEVVLFPYTYDLANRNKVKDAQESIVIGLNPEELKNTAVYDSINDKFYEKEYNPAPTKYIILVRNGVTFNPKELVKFIKEQMEE